MKVKSKDLRSASYKVVCSHNDYEISANVNIVNGEVGSLDSGAVVKNGEFVASFSEHGGQPNYNYSAIGEDEQKNVISLIFAFKTAALG